MKREALAIEVDYRDGQGRLLMAHWRLADQGWGNGRVMFNVEAVCGCWCDFETFHPCPKHVDVFKWRVVDAAAPTGLKRLVR